uniref:RING-type domain-containing protein n=2 Tax=Zooxanthella nutricula TaxID=1333877 RepID=A0A6U9HNJ6_9DINO|mmetsp:Transcript_97005/g.296485  ORF Transcript_97005/g.296485 Transcript_97005/m.296485 type:complete len:124 (+) Transcript_97005:99-470(+)
MYFVFVPLAGLWGYVLLMIKWRRQLDSELLPPDFKDAMCSFIQQHVTEERPEAQDTGDANTCAICLESLPRGPAHFPLPACGHEFHRECIEAWWACKRDRRFECPVCRTPQVADRQMLVQRRA